MDKYLLQKALAADELKKQERLNDALEFKNQLNSSDVQRNIVPDFQDKMVKDLPVDRINKLGEAVPVKSAADALISNAATAEAKAAEKIAQGRKNAIQNLAYDAGAMKQQYLDKLAQENGKKVYGTQAPVELDYKDLRKQMSAKNKLRAVSPVLGAVANVVPSAIDLSQGNPNTAAARLLTGAAPIGAESVADKLMEQAQIADKAPELQDPQYLDMLRKIGEARQARGKGSVVESFSGQPVDTAATEEDDFLNKLKAQQKLNSQG